MTVSLLIFNVPQHIPGRKQTFETLEKRNFAQTILDHFETTFTAVANKVETWLTMFVSMSTIVLYDG